MTKRTKKPKLTKEQKLAVEQEKLNQEKAMAFQKDLMAVLDKHNVDLQVKQQIVPVPRRRE